MEMIPSSRELIAKTLVSVALVAVQCPSGIDPRKHWQVIPRFQGYLNESNHNKLFPRIIDSEFKKKPVYTHSKCQWFKSGSAGTFLTPRVFLSSSFDQVEPVKPNLVPWAWN